MSIVAGTSPRVARIAALIASLVVLATLLAGCSSGGSDAAASYGAPAPQADGVDGGAGEDSDSGGTSVPSRAIIVTGSMYMTAENPLEAADKAATIVTASGGRIDARSETAPDEWTGGSAELTLRIPTSKLEPVVEDLRALGTVNEYATTASDVTNQVRDLDARISTLRASTIRIESLLADAQNIADIIKLEDELASRQAQLESLEAEQRGLGDQVSLSTIALTLTTVPVEMVDDDPATFVDGLATGWNSLTTFVSGALVVLGVLLPWLIVAAIITLAVVAMVRRSKARGAAAEQPEPEQAVEQPASVG